MNPTEELLREVFADRAGTVDAPADLYGAVLARRRRDRRRAVLGVGLAAMLVVGGTAVAVPALRGSDRALPARPTPTPSCIPPVLPGDQRPPAPVPVSQLPRQHDVRGSLAGNQAVVDAAVVAGWQGILSNEQGLASAGGGAHQMVKASLRVQFVERAGAGTLALATAADRTGTWQSAAWLVGQGTKLVPTGGPGAKVFADDGKTGQRFYGTDPLFVASYDVCGSIFGVVLAPPDAAATWHEAPGIGADAHLIPGPTRPVPLTGGLAVLPGGGSGTVTVTRGGTELGTGSLASLVGQVTGRPDPTRELLQKAIDQTPARVRELVATTVPNVEYSLEQDTREKITGLRVYWAGSTPAGRPAVLVAMTLRSGAVIVSNMWQDGANTSSGNLRGLVPAGQLDRTLFVAGDRNLLFVVVPKGATRAEVELAGGGTLAVPLHDGGGMVVPGAKPLSVRAYDADGTLVAEQTPGKGLVPGP